MVLQKTNSSQNNEVINDIHHLLSNECFPKFQKGDIVAGDNLPSSLTLFTARNCYKMLLKAVIPTPIQAKTMSDWLSNISPKQSNEEVLLFWLNQQALIS